MGSRSHTVVQILGRLTLLGMLLTAFWCSFIIAGTAAPIEIKLGYYESSGGLGITGKTMDALIQEFMAANPDIRVTTSVAAYASFFEQLPVHLAAGSGPDVWHGAFMRTQ